MVRLVLIIAVFTLLALKGRADTTGKLIENLRRQLMKDNYDYMERSGESEQLTTQPPEELPVIRSRDLDLSGYLNEEYPMRRADFIHEEIPNPQSLEDLSSKHPSRRNFESHSEPTIDVSDRDLHYYMDDDHVNNNHLENNFDDTRHGDEGTTVQYKVLEIRGQPGRSGRRSGQLGIRRRFLQEERPDHIAIVPLDDGPIPEFRLPRNRRQYMGDYSGSDEPPPSIPPLPGLMGLPATGPTPPVAARRHRAPEPDSEASTSTEIDPTRNRLQRRRSLEDELVYLTQ